MNKASVYEERYYCHGIVHGYLGAIRAWHECIGYFHLGEYPGCLFGFAWVFGVSMNPKVISLHGGVVNTSVFQGYG